MSGLLMQLSSAAGPYGVRGSDPNRLRGLENPADKTGFSDPVPLTVCPYLARCPARTLWGRPQAAPSRRRLAPEPRVLGSFVPLRPYHLLVAIEKTLLDQSVHSSWATVRDALATHAIVTIVLPTDSGATMRIRKASTPKSEHRELYRLLGVDEKIMSPKTIWSETGAHE